MPEQHAPSKFRVIQSGDRLTASVRILHKEADDSIDRAAVNAALVEAGVSPEFIDNTAVEQLLVAWRKSPQDEHEAVVARGKAPEHGADAKVVLDPQLQSRLDEARRAQESLPDAPAADTEGGADHYNRSAFVVVMATQRLGRLLPRTDGTDGVDISGRTLPATEGKKARVKLDRSIDIDESGFIAAAHSGRLVVGAAEIRVERELNISGDVDFSTGNIDFPGKVSVSRGVKDLFTVRCRASMTIGELVEAATLDARFDITLASGIAGRHKGVIRAGRDLHAKYIDSSTVFVGRSLTVEREINDSRVRVCSKLIAPGAVIIGGEVALGGSAECAQIGAESEIPTMIRLGVLDELERLAGAGLDRYDTVAEKRDQTQDRYNTIRKAAGAKAGASSAEELTELEAAIHACDKALSRLREGLGATADTLERFIEPEITVRRLIHRGAVIVVGPYRCQFGSAVKGPVAIRTNEQGSPVLLDLTAGISTPVERVAKVAREDDRWLLQRIRKIVPKAA